MKVKDILKTKGPEVFTIGREKTLGDAVKVLVNNNIGVLLVLDENAQTVGILSERDILRAVYHQPLDFHLNPVYEHMTGRIIVVEPDDDVHYVKKIMTENRIRHLPVFQAKILTGIISIGDVVKSQLSDFQTENKYLMDYITGNVK